MWFLLKIVVQTLNESELLDYGVYTMRTVSSHFDHAYLGSFGLCVLALLNKHTLTFTIKFIEQKLKLFVNDVNMLFIAEESRRLSTTNSFLIRYGRMMVSSSVCGKMNEAWCLTCSPMKIDQGSTIYWRDW